MGYTMAEKIMMKNTGLSHLAPGDLIMTRPDMCMVHDIYTPFVVQKLDEMKFRRLAEPEKAVIFLDHLCPTNQATGDPRHYHKGHELSDRFGIRKLHAGEGISHTLMHEYRYALPGTVVVATDSHTPTYGGSGCFCTGIGYTEMAATLGSGEMWMKVPEAIRITVEGELPAGLYAKDIVLQVLKDLRWNMWAAPLTRWICPAGTPLPICRWRRAAKPHFLPLTRKPPITLTCRWRRSPGSIPIRMPTMSGNCTTGQRSWCPIFPARRALIMFTP